MKCDREAKGKCGEEGERSFFQFQGASAFPFSALCVCPFFKKQRRLKHTPSSPKHTGLSLYILHLTQSPNFPFYLLFLFQFIFFPNFKIFYSEPLTLS